MDWTTMIEAPPPSTTAHAPPFGTEQIPTPQGEPMIVTTVLIVLLWTATSLVGGIAVGHLLRRRPHPAPVRRAPLRPILVKNAA